MDEEERDMMPMLERMAVECRPRLFAIYGTHKLNPNDVLMGWGMQFRAGTSTIFHRLDNPAIHVSNTPAQVFSVQEIVGDVRFRWLDA